LGHLDVIERSAHIFEQVVVGVAASPFKGRGPLFSLDERVALAQQAVQTAIGAKDSALAARVQVQPFTKLLVDFAAEIGADAIVKGLRAVTDFEAEFQQASLNYELNPNLETMFIMASPANMYLSSSVVKEVAQVGGRIAQWVTPEVAEALQEKCREL
jgi:pantetheine-phosphate adenylyltransferase